MCGIFGICVTGETRLTWQEVQDATKRLFLLSESRGKEASGLSILANGRIQLDKRPLPASKLLKSSGYKEMWQALETDLSARVTPPVAVIGHSRLVTNGLQGVSTNNQPVSKDGVVAVHNGIICNDAELWEKYPSLERRWEVDTEVITSLVRHHYQASKSIISAIKETFSEIEGSASVALMFDDVACIALATNTGSLYTATSHDGGIVVFSSEEYILRRFLSETQLQEKTGQLEVAHLKAGNGLIVDIASASCTGFSFDDDAIDDNVSDRMQIKVVDFSLADDLRREHLRRCTRCLLPETFPMISYDEDGVCSVCRDYQPIQLQGKDALMELADKYRSKGDEADCIVAFSGGRDSSYMLHYVKQELGLTPVAYGYDWGMVTDIARRNQARLTGKLGVEYIVVSADIRQKRKNIQKNINAWLKRPSLGMIPLFMAGDKQYFYHLARLRRQLGIDLAFLGGNPLEKTGFKTGFTGVKESGGRTYDISAAKKARIALYYGTQFLLNPGYLNRSLLDTANAYYSSYMLKHDFTWLFRYIKWDEDEIDGVLKHEYDWEVATDTDTTWRIGDGTAAFYNYIYYTVAGFTENDTLRSNQIREGMISREDALKTVQRDNQPRYETMKEYAYQVGFDLDEALYVINSMPKLY